MLKRKEEKWLPRVLDNSSVVFRPSFEIMDQFYPSQTCFGTGTFLSHNMAINVIARRSKGTGNNKNCAFCRTRERMIKQTGDSQISHQLKKCSALATLSNNEVDLLLALRDACHGSDKKIAQKLKTKKFLFGCDKKSSDPDLLRLNYQTLLRHATKEEIQSGQHVNGLRINLGVWKEMRRVDYLSMRHQFEGSLFGTLHPTTLYLMSGFRQILTTTTNVASLIYDSQGELFLSSKFDAKTKKPLRTFESNDNIYFSFEEKSLSPTLLKQNEFFRKEQQNQMLFINMCNYSPSMLNI
jgi:hypothetical protein